MNTNDFINKLRLYICNQIDIMAKDTPMIGFVKPLITRVVNNNIHKVSSFTDMIADENGNIDITTILDEMIDNLRTTQPFKVNIPIIGNLHIGEGCIKMEIPFTDKFVVLTSDDLRVFRDTFIG